MPQPSPMGFVLSILYFVVYYLTPATLFGPLGAYHIELILAALLVVVSIPTLAQSFILKTPQSLALIGLAVAVFLSVLIGVRWPGGQYRPSSLSFRMPSDTSLCACTATQRRGCRFLP